MTTERRRLALRIAEEALDRAPGERGAVLDEACGGDDRLRAEVEELLRAHDRDPGFLETPVRASAVTLLGDDLVGRRIGGFLIEAEIARGGMGVVYTARDLSLERLVAIKALSPRLAGDPDYRERLRREAQAAGGVRHEGIAIVHTLLEWGDDLFIVSEFVEGETLRRRLARGPIRARAAMELALGVARALAAAHARGVVHRDLKPENVMVQPDGRPKVLDFGIAHVPGPPSGDAETRQLTRPGFVIGTPGYMAPEQLGGETVDARTDVFALGILLYEMVAGRPPFPGEGTDAAAAVLHDDPPPPGGVPAGLDRIIATCLQKAPAARYQSAADVAAALDAVLASHESGPMPAAPPSGAMWWWRFHQMAATAIYSVTLVPAWQFTGRLPGMTGRWLFFGLVAAVCLSGGLRLHLWFTSRQSPARLPALHDRARPWVRWADRGWAALLVAGGGLVSDSAPGFAAACIALGVGGLVASHFVEEATAEEAMRSALPAASQSA